MAQKVGGKRRAPWSRRKIVVVSLVGIMVVAAISCTSFWMVARITSVGEAGREAEIAQKVEDYRGEVVKSCTSFVKELNALSGGLYSNAGGVDGVGISDYISRLEGIEVPDEAFAEMMDMYIEAWQSLRESYDIEDYDGAMIALEEVQRVAKATSAGINVEMDGVIERKVEAYAGKLKEEK